MSLAEREVPLGQWCQVHNRHEPDLPGDFRVCGECWHVFRTPDDLLTEHRAVMDAAGVPDKTRDPAAIYACPLCAHDF